MDQNKIEKIDNFLKEKEVKKPEQPKVVNQDTITEKDGIVERINVKYVTNDGRQLLRD